MKLPRVLFIFLFALLLQCCFSQEQFPAYDEGIAAGRASMAQGDLKAAYVDALTLIAQDQKRFEAYALAALVLTKQGSSQQANYFLQSAIERAPEAKKGALKELVQLITKQTGKTSVSPAEIRRKYDVLQIVIQDADKSQSDAERRTRLRELIDRSIEFLALAPSQTNIVVLCAVASLEVNDVGAGWLMGHRMIKLGLENSDEPLIRTTFANLDRKGWLNEKIALTAWRINEVLALATEGDMKAELELGRRTWGNVEAAGWYYQAAAKGDADAMWRLGIIYGGGRGVLTDKAAQLKWYNLAAEHGSADAKQALALIAQQNEKLAADAAREHRLSELMTQLVAITNQPNEAKDIGAKILSEAGKEEDNDSELVQRARQMAWNAKDRATELEKWKSERRGTWIADSYDSDQKEEGFFEVKDDPASEENLIISGHLYFRYGHTVDAVITASQLRFAGDDFELQGVFVGKDPRGKWKTTTAKLTDFSEQDRKWNLNFTFNGQGREGVVLQRK